MKNKTTASEILWILISILLTLLTLHTIFKADYKRSATFLILTIVAILMYYLKKRLKNKNN